MNRTDHQLEIENENGRKFNYRRKVFRGGVDNSAFLVVGWKYRQAYNLAIANTLQDAEEYLRQHVEYKVGRCNLDKQSGRKLDSFVIKKFEIYEGE